MYLSIYLSITKCMYVCMYVSIYLSQNLWMYVCISKFMYVSIYLSIYLSQYVYMYVSILVRILSFNISIYGLILVDSHTLSISLSPSVCLSFLHTHTHTDRYPYINLMFYFDVWRSFFPSLNSSRQIQEKLIFILFLFFSDVDIFLLIFFNHGILFSATVFTLCLAEWTHLF